MIPRFQACRLTARDLQAYAWFLVSDSVAEFIFSGHGLWKLHGFVGSTAAIQAFDEKPVKLGDSR